MSDPWRCSHCGKPYGVPSLARDCETRCEDRLTAPIDEEGPPCP